MNEAKIATCKLRLAVLRDVCNEYIENEGEFAKVYAESVAKVMDEVLELLED